MARTAELSLKIFNAGILLGSFVGLDLGTGLSGTDEGNGLAGLTGSASAGSNIATQELTPTQSGSNITLDLTMLSHSFVAIELVFRNGQRITPISSWSISGNTITVFNADATEEFAVQYTY